MNTPHTLRPEATQKPKPSLAVPWLSLLLLASPVAWAAPESGFRLADLDGKSLGLWEGDKPVLVYNHGVLLKPGVPANRARSTYLHPLYGLDGEVLTDDFPKDH